MRKQYSIFAGAKRLNLTKMQFDMAEFALKYPGWHGLAQDRATLRVAKALEKKGCIEINEINEQFQWKQ